MLNKIAKNINIILDNQLDEQAIINVVNAKLANLFGFKGITFKSTLNLKKARVLSYYAFNFVPSGVGKNLLVDEINDCLFSFMPDVVAGFNEIRKEKMQDELSTIVLNSKNLTNNEGEKLIAEKEREIKNMPLFHTEMLAATQAEMYEKFKIISDNKKGSLLLKNTEFANFYQDTILGNDKTKKEYCDMLYDLYDGDYYPISAMSTRREELHNLPISCILMSDYKLILQDDKLSKAFKSWLERGMARRSFFYFKKNNYVLKEFKIVPREQKRQAYKELEDCEQVIRRIYDSIPDNNEFIFSSEADDLLDDFKIKCKKRGGEFHKLLDVLSTESDIMKINIVNAPWKVAKLSLIYNLLTYGFDSIIKTDSVQKAIDYFEQMHLSLIDMITANTVSDYDKMFAYLVENMNKFHSKTQLSSKKFVNPNMFTKWFDEAVNVIREMAANKKLGFVYMITKKTNKTEIALYDAKKYRFEEDKETGGGRLIQLNKPMNIVNEI